MRSARVDAILQVWHLLYQASWPQFATRSAELLPDIHLPEEFGGSEKIRAMGAFTRTPPPGTEAFMHAV